MTEAQRAAFNLFCSTPRERIRTHAAPDPGRRGPGGIPGKLYHVPRGVASVRRRRWIAQNAAAMTVKQMSESLGVHVAAVWKHIRVLGIRPKPDKHGPKGPRKPR